MQRTGAANKAKPAPQQAEHMFSLRHLRFKSYMELQATGKLKVKGDTFIRGDQWATPEWSVDRPLRRMTTPRDLS